VSSPPLRLQFGVARAADDRVVAGVCAGLAVRGRTDPTLVRLAFAVASFAAGAGVVAYLALWALLPDGGCAVSRKRRVAGVVLLLVAAPLIFAAGYVLRRFLPAWALAPIQAGLIATAVLVVFTLPSLGVPRNVANPSRLPNHYNRNLAVILALVWLGVLGGLVRARRRGRA